MLFKGKLDLGRGVDVELAGKLEAVAFQASGTLKNEKPIDVGGLFTINEASVGGDLNAIGVGISGKAGFILKDGRFRLKVGAGATAFIGARFEINLDIQLNTNAFKNATSYFESLFGF